MSESKVKFFPAPGRYLVKVDVAETVSPGGLHIPPMAESKNERGIIMAVGDARITEYGARMLVTYHLGDRILYAKYAGNEVKIDGVDYIVLSEADILGDFSTR